MASILGTAGNDLYSGVAGIADIANIDALQTDVRFEWNVDRWVVSGPVGSDQLVSIEQAQLADALFQLSGPGSYALGISQATAIGQPGSVARLADGSFLHTLGSLSGATFDIVARHYSATGELLAAPLTINTTIAGNQIGPDIAVLTTGDYVITWHGPDAASNGIYMQRFSAAGAALGGEVLVNTATAFDETNSSVTALAGGRYLVTWESSGADGSQSGIFGQLYTSAGAVSGGEFRISVSTLLNQDNVSIGALFDGGFIATYNSAGSLKFQRYTSAGLPAGAEVTLGTLGVLGSHGQSVIVLPGDRVVIANDDNSAINVTTVVVTATGPVTVVPTTTISDPGKVHSLPAAAVLFDGSYVIAWFGSNGPKFDLHVQHLDSVGRLIGGDQVIAAGLSAANNSIEIAADGFPGGYMVQYLDAATNGVQAIHIDVDDLPVLPTITGDEASNLIRASQTGTSGLRLNGLQGNDRLFGTNLGDILDGGEGNDVLTGGAGNDTYIVTQQDRIIETAAGGIDTVIVRDNYVLSAADFVL